jgi:hypothetical protein
MVLRKIARRASSLRGLPGARLGGMVFSSGDALAPEPGICRMAAL